MGKQLGKALYDQVEIIEMSECNSCAQLIETEAAVGVIAAAGWLEVQALRDDLAIRSFILRNNKTASVFVTDPTSVVYIPVSSGTPLLLSVKAKADRRL